MRRSRCIQFTLALLALLVVPRTTMAQCGDCAPERTPGHVYSVQLHYYFDSNVPYDVRMSFNAAAGLVMSALQSNGRPRADIGEGGTDFVVVYDPELDDEGIWAQEQWNSATGCTVRIGIGNNLRLYSEDFKHEVFGHELLHAVGYDEADCGQGDTIMSRVKVPWGNLTPEPVEPDECAISRDRDFPERVRSGDPNTPILIDLEGGGLRFSNIAVPFDLRGDGQVHSVSWPEPFSGAAFLAYDRNADGTIDNGSELFGNSTPLGWAADGPTAANGFEALASFDAPENGGNGDGVIDQEDMVFDHLVLWSDSDCNGTSDAGELRTATDAGLKWISLSDRESHRTDATGTLYAYRAKVGIERNHDGNVVQRFAYDIIFFVR